MAGARGRTLPVTARTLETIIRLATAHAKCHLRGLIQEEDAEARYKLQVTSYKLQVTSYKLQVTSYKLQITSFAQADAARLLPVRLPGRAAACHSWGCSV